MKEPFVPTNTWTAFTAMVSLLTVVVVFLISWAVGWLEPFRGSFEASLSKLPPQQQYSAVRDRLADMTKYSGMRLYLPSRVPTTVFANYWWVHVDGQEGQYNVLLSTHAGHHYPDDELPPIELYVTHVDFTPPPVNPSRNPKLTSLSAACGIDKISATFHPVRLTGDVYAIEATERDYGAPSFSSSVEGVYGDWGFDVEGPSESTIGAAEEAARALTQPLARAVRSVGTLLPGPFCLRSSRKSNVELTFRRQSDLIWLSGDLQDVIAWGGEIAREARPGDYPATTPR